MNWHGKRYYSFDSFLKNYFGAFRNDRRQAKHLGNF